MPKTQSQENTESKQEGMYLVVTAETPQIQPWNQSYEECEAIAGP